MLYAISCECWLRSRQPVRSKRAQVHPHLFPQCGHCQTVGRLRLAFKVALVATQSRLASGSFGP